MRTSYSEQQLRDAVKNNFSIRQVLKTLGLKEAGGNYATIKNKIKEFNIDNSHFTGRGHLKGKTHNWKKSIPLEKILVEYSNYQSHKLKLRLIKEKIMENKCLKCKTSTWEGETLSLHLDHINGTKTDNRIENLQLLCPNCHSLTSTYCGKNKKNQPKIYKKSIKTKSLLPKALSPKNKCTDCGFVIGVRAERCVSCATKLQPTKIKWPPIEELKERLGNSNYSKLGKELGVSDNAIRKHLKNNTS